MKETYERTAATEAVGRMRLPRSTGGLEQNCRLTSAVDDDDDVGVGVGARGLIKADATAHPHPHLQLQSAAVRSSFALRPSTAHPSPDREYKIKF